MATTPLKYEIKFRQRQAAKKEFEHWSNADFINCILELRNELETKLQQEDLKDEKEKSNQTTEPKKITEANYNQEWSFPTKIVFLLTLKNKPLISAEINILLLQLDKTYKKFKTPKKTLAGILARMRHSKRITKIKQAGG